MTGIFTGSRHEGMAGTLDRDDLTAAFGESRDLDGDQPLRPPTTNDTGSAETISHVGSYPRTGTERYNEYSFDLYHFGRFSETRWR